MRREELAAKFHDCAQALLSTRAEQQAVEMIYNLEALADVKKLTALLRIYLKTLHKAWLGLMLSPNSSEL
jgi:hypothetical protein